jgi:hypothetical protein
MSKLFEVNCVFIYFLVTYYYCINDKVGFNLFAPYWFHDGLYITDRVILGTS